MKRKKTLDGIRFNGPATIFAIRHTTTNSSSCCSSNDTSTEQQQQRQQHSVCINTCQVYNTVRRTAVQHRAYQVLEVRLDCETTRRQAKKRREKKKTADQAKKLRARWDSNRHADMLMALILPVHPLRFFMLLHV